MRSRWLPALLLTLGLALAACGGDDGDGSDGADDAGSADSAASSGATSDGPTTCDYPAAGTPAVKGIQAPPATPTATGKVAVTMATSVGDLRLTLDAERAPCTVNSFLSLMDQGYFDKTSCHRLTTDPAQIFVLQCGDPQADGYGGPGYTIPDELTGRETYGPGVVAMAKGRTPDSGGSQFFIVYDDSLLDADFSIFGTADSASVQIVRKVAAAGAKPAGDGTPNTPVDISTVSRDRGSSGPRKPGDPETEPPVSER